MWDWANRGKITTIVYCNSYNWIYFVFIILHKCQYFHTSILYRLHLTLYFEFKTLVILEKASQVSLIYYSSIWKFW